MGKRADMFVPEDQDPREGTGRPADERANLADYLRHHRLTLELKCAGLSPEQLATRSVEPSTMSLLGLVRHMGEVERYWFRRVLAGLDVPRLYRDSDEPDDGDWDGAVADPAVVEQAWANWRAEVAFAEEWIAGAGDMGAVVRDRRGNEVTVREVLVHMVEEYARHNGHADLLRERIDGRVGQ